MKNCKIEVFEHLAIVGEEVKIEINSIVVGGKYYIKFNRESVSDLYLLQAITRKHYKEVIDELNDRFDENFEYVGKVDFSVYDPSSL